MFISILFWCLFYITENKCLTVNRNHQMEQNDNYLMPEENAIHLRTWMGFPSNSYKLYESDFLNGLRANVIHVAKTIAKYEPVNLIVNSVNDKKIAEELLEKLEFETNHDVSLIVHPIDDLWLRDTGPVFVKNSENENCAIDFNFDGWGGKQECESDSKIAKFIGEYSNVCMVETSLILEGGGLEVDGEGTAILAESCILNDNRNPGVSKDEVEKELERLLGIKKIIWVPGVRGLDITDGHIDFFVKFVGSHLPGVVFVHLDENDPSTQENLSIIQNSTDFKGRKLTPVVIPMPSREKIRKPLLKKKDAALGYINFYSCNGAILCAEFGDAEADRNAFDILSKHYPDKVIEQLNIDYIAISGGGIHCATQQQPL